MMATLANGGTRVVPHLVKAIDDGSGWKAVPPPDNPFKPVIFKPSTVSAIHDGLWLAVNGAGTAGRARIYGRDVSGKTGTAQVISNQGKERAGKTDRDLRDHGWFVFMQPRDNPELAGVVFLEHGEHGYYGGPIARHVIETYYAQKEGRPLPRIENINPGVPTAPGSEYLRTVVASASESQAPPPTVAARPGGN
jgi:penicillin-binding protein 2